MNINRKSGFTLIELLIAIALMGLIVGALDQVAARILSTYSAVQASQDLVPQARYALERMVTFVQESDQIQTPPTTDPTEVLAVSERLSDQYTNATRTYTAAGDSFPMPIRMRTAWSMRAAGIRRSSSPSIWTRRMQPTGN